MIGKSREKLNEYKRVLKVTKKPNKQEFLTIFKVSGIGILVIGAIGFLINMIYQALVG
ncbi:protein translocase SEC61 complex subunit gamma [Candidatus Woesearchaeota archaeon]|nr:protein translocase SEC61 complex subunit gamma [Candidatus Woesearchaeota archaeon]MBW3016818.1 protein translocase SEC61 complex subunit gamma [Candidatus Woesearchaeota archaeon]